MLILKGSDFQASVLSLVLKGSCSSTFQVDTGDSQKSLRGRPKRPGGRVQGHTAREVRWKSAVKVAEQKSFQFKDNIFYNRKPVGFCQERRGMAVMFSRGDQSDSMVWIFWLLGNLLKCNACQDRVAAVNPREYYMCQQALGWGVKHYANVCKLMQNGVLTVSVTKQV